MYFSAISLFFPSEIIELIPSTFTACSLQPKPGVTKTFARVTAQLSFSEHNVNASLHLNYFTALTDKALTSQAARRSGNTVWNLKENWFMITKLLSLCPCLPFMAPSAACA